jgi:DNA uptake protein ComE-like DNA-binding protein
MKSSVQPPRARAAVGVAVLLVATHWVCAGLSAAPASATPLHGAQVQFRLDPNRASAAELALLPRIGQTLAENIIAYRASVPPPAFRQAEDLDRVRRIGPATVEVLRPFLTFDDEPVAAAATESR